MPQFRKARYVKSKAEKGAYIVYYAFDAQKGRLARQRHYIPEKDTKQRSRGLPMPIMPLR